MFGYLSRPVLICGCVVIGKRDMNNLAGFYSQSAVDAELSCAASASHVVTGISQCVPTHR